MTPETTSTPVTTYKEAIAEMKRLQTIIDFINHKNGHKAN